MSAASQAPGDRDLTARARIRDAAIVRFAEEGVAGASLKAIAADAGVSSPLVSHHFGSKEGLREACDRQVVDLIRAGKEEAMAAGTSLDPFQAMRDAARGPLLRYLARTLVDGSPHVAELIDEMVDDAVQYMKVGVEQGLLMPTDAPRDRAAVLTLWQLGALVLNDHVQRLVGADLTSDDPEALLPWMAAVVPVLAEGVIHPDYYAHWRDAFRSHRSERDE